jgi:N-methylhydantoinase B
MRSRSRGGGYGSALERPAEDVAEDVRQGYVGIKEARELYGVAVDPETFAVDEAETERLRSSH